MLQQRRRHYFPENDCHVVTGILPNGEYGAYREEQDEGRIRGHGHSRWSAIADMVEMIAKSDSEADEMFSEAM